MGLAQLNFSTDHFLAWTCMVFLGFSIEIALLASTAAIMSSVPPQKRVQQVLLKDGL